MKTKTFFTILFCLPIFFGCQQALQTEPEVSNQQEAELIADAEGNLLHVECLRANAASIAEQGREGALRCSIGNIKTKEVSKDAAEGRGFFYYYDYGYGYNGNNYWNNWYMYPPYYNYDYNYYYDNYDYSDWDVGNQWSFCKYVFNYDWDNSCYSDIFLFDNNSYDNHSNYQCSHCMYRSNPSKCYNRCWYKDNWYW